MSCEGCTELLWYTNYGPPPQQMAAHKKPNVDLVGLSSRGYKV